MKVQEKQVISLFPGIDLVFGTVHLSVQKADNQRRYLIRHNPANQSCVFVKLTNDNNAADDDSAGLSIYFDLCEMKQIHGYGSLFDELPTQLENLIERLTLCSKESVSISHSFLLGIVDNFYDNPLPEEYSIRYYQLKVAEIIVFLSGMF